ncbi:MAG: hypothetical protein CML06_17930 [Pseudomonadales bacterium]|nr:hypothetical protein [Pseudomonadales bacterium]
MKKFKKSKIKQKKSCVPVQLSMYLDDTKLSSGTAFFFELDGEIFLITNWHNFSGRRPDNGQPISETTGATPNKYRIYIPVTNPIEANFSEINYREYTCNLYKDDDQLYPHWFEHPTFRHKVDLVAVPVNDFSLPNMLTITANSEKLALSKLDVRPGMDAFVLGYPIGLSGGAKFPIWKRASIASEPDIDLNNLPMFYIDTATKSGMSGSPVYAQESGFWAPEGKQIPDDAVFGTGHRFIGIYSGRVGDNALEAQLGIVWKESAIIETIQARVLGRNPLESVK